MRQTSNEQASYKPKRWGPLWSEQLWGNIDRLSSSCFVCHRKCCWGQRERERSCRENSWPHIWPFVCQCLIFLLLWALSNMFYFCELSFKNWEVQICLAHGFIECPFMLFQPLSSSKLSTGTETIAYWHAFSKQNKNKYHEAYLEMRPPTAWWAWPSRRPQTETATSSSLRSPTSSNEF